MQRSKYDSHTGKKQVIKTAFEATQILNLVNKEVKAVMISMFKRN